MTPSLPQTTGLSASVISLGRLPDPYSGAPPPESALRGKSHSSPFWDLGGPWQCGIRGWEGGIHSELGPRLPPAALAGAPPSEVPPTTLPAQRPQPGNSMAAPPCCPQMVLLGRERPQGLGHISQGDWYLKRVLERVREKQERREASWEVLSSCPDTPSQRDLAKKGFPLVCAIESPNYYLGRSTGPGRLRAPPPHSPPLHFLGHSGSGFKTRSSFLLAACLSAQSQAAAFMALLSLLLLSTGPQAPPHAAVHPPSSTLPPPVILRRNLLMFLSVSAEVGSRLCLLVSSSGVPVAPPEGTPGLRLRWGVEGEQARQPISYAAPGCRGGPASDSPQFPASDSGTLCSDLVRKPDRNRHRTLASDTETDFWKTGLFLCFYKCRLHDQHRHGAISMEFIRRMVCALTITRRERTQSQPDHNPDLFTSH